MTEQLTANRPFVRNLLLTLSLVLVAVLFHLFAPVQSNVWLRLSGRLAILGLGSAVLIAALARRRRRPTGPALLSALSAWLLLPLLAGPLAAALFDLGLMNYYHSADFRRVNSAWHGVRIEMADQAFDFAVAQPRTRAQSGPRYTGREVRPEGLHQCEFAGYTATYHIEAKEDQQLTFALVQPEGARSSDDPDPAAQSIQAVFKQVGSGHAEGAGWQGLFQVPRGSHTLVVHSKAPFLLQVYGTQALWTRDLVLSGRRHYAPFYADAFSRTGFEAAANGAQPATCAPVGCPDEPKGLFGLVIPPMREGRAAIHDVVDEQAVDADGDGFYDQLDLVLVVDVRQTGHYILTAVLSTPEGNDLFEAIYATPDDEQLCYGERRIKLSFPGRALARSGTDGPYVLRLVQLEWEEQDGYSNREEVDYRRVVYITAHYSAQEFGPAR